MNGMSQQCLIYDLRKSSSITLPLIGHESSVNCIRFTSKFDASKASSSGVGPKQSEAPVVKTVEQIREEAKARVGVKKQQTKKESEPAAQPQPKSAKPIKEEKKVFKYEELPDAGMRSPLDMAEPLVPADSGQLKDFGDVIEPQFNEKKPKKTDVSSDELKAYIERRMAAKLGSLQDELNGMIDNF